MLAAESHKRGTRLQPKTSTPAVPFDRLCQPWHTCFMPLAEKLDPVMAALLNAPDSDEPETDEERAAVEAAKAEVRAGGRLYSHEEVRKHWLDEE